MMLDDAALARVLRASGVDPVRAGRHGPAIARHAPAYGVMDTPLRLAHFLSQILAESGGLRWTSELWGPTPAQKRYEGRADLGNTQPGDGSRYRGRGLMQTTGRANYRALTKHVRAKLGEGPDFEAQPHIVADPPWAALSAFAWWDDNGANRTADRGDTEAAVLAVSRHVNAGSPDSRVTPNGFDHRLDYFRKAAAAIRREAGMKPTDPLTAWPKPRPAPVDVEPVEPLPPEPFPSCVSADDARPAKAPAPGKQQGGTK